MGNIAIPSSGRTAHLVSITRASSSGAYLSILDVYSNESVRISSNNGTSVTIGNITYTARGKDASYIDQPKFTINKNGTIYKPSSSGQPTKSTYTSGTVLGVGGDHAPSVYLFSPD